ncbi:hypothetical protein [Tautonia plasticadhaerens]|uniref:Uncharacterized protein n=1 Tax=Tautonia plasticadhaerens TaxID=2527974 RepID=A0A518HDX5_9BACT|nr:hypothetical protein [Tautonia plasticadhaerens]QDV39057.1 hypothetical protein ElP_70200 [Tautonia plasticadhaerens]
MSTPTEPTQPSPDPISPAPPAPDAPPASAAPKEKAKVSPTRNAVSLVLLAVLLVVGGLELAALFRFNGAVNKLDQALEANEVDLLPLEQVEEILGKQPDGPLREGDPGTRQTTYTWQGAIRSHVLTAYYSYGDKPGLVRYEIGDVKAADPGE